MNKVRKGLAKSEIIRKRNAYVNNTKAIVNFEGLLNPSPTPSFTAKAKRVKPKPSNHKNKSMFISFQTLENTTLVLVFFILQMINFFTINLHEYFYLSREGRGLFKKVPRFVVPSDSEASLTLFWTASYGESSRLAARSDILYPVVPSDSKASKDKEESLRLALWVRGGG